MAKNKCMIKNGHPYTEWYVCPGDKQTVVDDALVSSFSEAAQNAIFKWIKGNVTPRKTANDYHTSYEMKHILERDIGIYMTNNQFKDAMMMCGFYPVEGAELNWRYRISEKSPCFVDRKRKVVFDCVCGTIFSEFRDNCKRDYMVIPNTNHQSGFAFKAICKGCGRTVSEIVWREGNNAEE